MLFTEALSLVFLVTGFTVGAGHCIGMCGPIVVSLSLSLKEKGAVIPHLLYNAGRVTTYAILGGIMGATGSFTQIASTIAVFQKGAMIFAGFLIMVMGLAMTGCIPLGSVFQDYYTPGNVFTKGFRSLMNRHSVTAYFPVGLLLGLLPCGPVYTALIAAARAGMETSTLLEGSVAGIGLMLAFGVGTIPALLCIAKLSSFRWLRSREVVYKIGAVLMIFVGLYFVVRGLSY